MLSASDPMMSPRPTSTQKDFFQVHDAVLRSVCAAYGLCVLQLKELEKMAPKMKGIGELHALTLHIGTP